MARPQTTVILAMTVDGKIADFRRSAARFSSTADKAHLENQLSLVDAVLFGAGTLRAYGTTLPIRNPRLLNRRQQSGKPPQPIHIVCSISGNLNPQLRFFTQPVPRWLLTTPDGAKFWQVNDGFDRLLTSSTAIDWLSVLTQLRELGIENLAILGGGELVASLLAVDLIDEFWITLCPVILGGADAPTPVEGNGFPAIEAKKLELLSLEKVGQEIFCHYRVIYHSRSDLFGSVTLF